MALSGFVVASVAAAAAAASANATSAFTDRFTRLDAERWVVSDGWANGAGELNDWRRSQVTPGRSGLMIKLDKNPASLRTYSSGEVKSRASYRYGYFEARMKAVAGSGVDTGFFTYTGPPMGRPWNEIDVEILGRNPRAVQLTYHTGDQQRATTVNLPFDTSEASHTYGFDWQPKYIRWYIDGRMVHEEDGGGLALPSDAQYILLNLWTSNNLPAWLGHFEWPGQSLSAQIGCVAAAPRYPGTAMC